MPKPAGRPLARLAPAVSLIPGQASSTVQLTERQMLFHRPEAATAVETFEKILGGKGKLTEDLLSSPEITPNIRKVLSLLLDPRQANRSLSALCADADVLPGEVFGAFRDAVIAKTTVRALVEVSERLPKITVDYLIKATDHEVVCPLCSGSRKYLLVGGADVSKKKRRKAQPKPAEMSETPVGDQIVDCPRCNASGVVLVEADASRQETVFEIMGLLKKGGGIQISQTNQTVAVPQDTGGGLGGLEQLQQAVAGMIFQRQTPPARSAETIDVEPIEEADQSPSPSSSSPSDLVISGPSA